MGSPWSSDQATDRPQVLRRCQGGHSPTPMESIPRDFIYATVYMSGWITNSPECWAAARLWRAPLLSRQLWPHQQQSQVARSECQHSRPPHTGILRPPKPIQVNWVRKPCSEVLRDPQLVQSRNFLPRSGQKLVSLGCIYARNMFIFAGKRIIKGDFPSM